MELYINGAFALTARGYHNWPGGKVPVLDADLPELPFLGTVMETPPARYGRFDGYTRQAFYCAAWALKSAGISEQEHFRNMGICLASGHETLTTDLAFYETTKEEDGAFTSPNLFSYTLPGIAGGELAIHYKLTGPLITMGDDSGGRDVLRTSAMLIGSGQADEMLCGWNEYADGLPDDRELRNGTIFAVLSRFPAPPGQYLPFKENLSLTDIWKAGTEG